MLTELRSRWPFVALVVSAALLVGAHAFQTFGHMAPCPMCLAQREWHWGILAIALIGFGMARTRPAQLPAALFIIGLAYLGSFAMAGWHVAVEQHWVTARCEAASGPLGNLSFNLDAPIEAPHCDTPAWTLFGVSMAGYNALISLAMALCTFWLTTRKEA